MSQFRFEVLRDVRLATRRLLSATTSLKDAETQPCVACVLTVICTEPNNINAATADTLTTVLEILKHITISNILFLKINTKTSHKTGDSLSFGMYDVQPFGPRLPQRY